MLVQVPPVLQSQVFPVNVPPEDIQDFNVIFHVDSRLWEHKVLIKRSPVVKEHN